ncbi:MAG: DUF805 domain-containing protein [Calditrichaceae bacterium]|nr:DUF805 domain-containing protein [Calditrichaceae bacterium]
MKWYLEVLKKYAVFSGKASRQEFWMFVLFNLIFSIVASILDNVLGTSVGSMGYGIISTLYLLAVLIPSIAVTIRRLHDTGRSGWWILLVFIPIIGWIWLIVLMILKGKA